MKPGDYPLIPDARDALNQIELLGDDRSIADSTRCQLAVALLLTVWQFAGPAFTPRPPSYLLVHAGTGEDPLLSVLTECAEWHRNFGCGVSHGNRAARIYQSDNELAREQMKTALTVVSRWLSSGDPQAQTNPAVAKWAEQWVAMRNTLFGCPQVTPLGEAWDPDFGVITGPDGYLSLLVKDDADLETLVQKSKGKAPAIIHPRGYDEKARARMKQIALLGGIAGGSWNSRLFQFGMRDGLPIVFLPHVGGSIPDVPKTAWAMMVSSVAREWRESGRRLRIPSECAQMVGHAALYDQVLYQELSAVPTGFAFRLMKIARDLQSIALEFVSAAAAQSGVSCPNREARCYLKLYVAALRGICYAAATTAFFPQNWRFEKERDNAWAILDFVRSRTSVSRRDILVKYPRLSAKTRDPLLEVLAGLHLIELEGSLVHAIALKDYLSRIPSRAGFPSADLDFRPRMRNRSRF